MRSVTSRRDEHAPAGGPTPQAAFLIARTDLIERLSGATAQTVILVVAPAGSGKTVLLRSWLQAEGLSDNAAWVTVERHEQDPQRFWTAVIAALRSTPGGSSLTTLRPSPDFDGRRVLDRLLIDLESVEKPILLVIDDLHELASPEANEQLGQLIARRPACLRIALSTRHDPQLGLRRLRLDGQLLEIRLDDLRFSVDETRDLLSGADVALTDESLQLLYDRTEGWVAGLRLAALSLARHPDPERLVADFSGSDRIVADYLLGEVLERQTDDVRELLLRTSVVDEVSGSLAEALTDNPTAERILLDLESSGAFVTAVDRWKEWFRYHQLFVDLLRLELRRQVPELVPDLHRRAAAWYSRRGDVLRALRHAQAAEDWPMALQLVSDNATALLLEGNTSALTAAIDSFPAESRDDPELAWVRAAIAMQRGSLDQAEAQLSIARSRSAEVPAARRPAFDMQVATIRLAIDVRRGDFESVSSEVQALLDPAAPRTEVERIVAAGARSIGLVNLGIVEYWTYQLESAIRHLEQALDMAREMGQPRIEIMSLSHLALAQSTISLDRQRELAAEAIALTEAHGWDRDPVAVTGLAAMATADVIQARFEDARPWLLRAEAALTPNVDPAIEIMVRFLSGMLDLGAGQTLKAIDVMAAAAAIQRRLVTRHVVTLIAHEYICHLQLRLGNAAAARQLLEGLPEDERDEAEARVAEADIRLDAGEPGIALELLEPILAGRTRYLGEYTLIQALIVAAAAHDRLGDRAATAAALERALDVAERESLVMPFVVTAKRALLEQHPRHDTKHASLVSDILDVLDGASARPRPADSALVEELTESELRVLRYLPSNLSAPEIANELFVSTSTVKTHMRHIYEKLVVHGRNEAVERARQVGLLARASRGRQ